MSSNLHFKLIGEYFCCTIFLDLIECFGRLETLNVDCTRMKQPRFRARAVAMVRMKGSHYNQVKRLREGLPSEGNLRFGHTLDIVLVVNAFGTQGQLAWKDLNS